MNEIFVMSEAGTRFRFYTKSLNKWGGKYTRVESLLMSDIGKVICTTLHFDQGWAALVRQQLLWIER